MDYREELQKALQRAGGSPAGKDGESLECYWDICCGCVLCTEQEEEEKKTGGDPSLVQTFLEYATWLEGFDHMLDRLYMATSRMSDAVSEPSLRLPLLRIHRQVLERISARCGHDLNSIDDIQLEIDRLERMRQR